MVAQGIADPKPTPLIYHHYLCSVKCDGVRRSAHVACHSTDDGFGCCNLWARSFCIGSNTASGLFLYSE